MSAAGAEDIADAVGPIAVGHTMTSWPGRQVGGLGWACVGLGGEACSEAIIGGVARADARIGIEEVQFGRP